MSFTITKERVYETLQTVLLPDSSRSIVEANLVSALYIKNNSQIGFIIALNEHLSATQGNALKKESETVLLALPGVTEVNIIVTADKRSPIEAEGTAKQVTTPKTAAKVKRPLQGVKHIVLVGAGKGGVGKSTLTVNLAIALNKLGLKVGIADADIYGPSVPHLLNIAAKPQLENGKMLPCYAYDIAVMSFGLLVAPEQATIWRGPMVTKAIYQLLDGVMWNSRGELDVLLIDLPPGTGDVTLSLCENYTIAGAVVIGTSQKIALADVRKMATMLKRMEVPLYGFIENMSYIVDEQGKPHYLGAEANARDLAAEIETPLWGAVPLLPAISHYSDEGKPYALQKEDTIFLPLAKEFLYALERSKS